MSRENIKKWVLILFLSFFLLYGLYESYKLLSGPKIVILEPQNGAAFEKNLIDIKGTAKNVAFLNLNDRPIFVDKQGNFSEKILLLSGYNIMTLKGEDRFKKKVEKQMQFFLKAEMPLVNIVEPVATTTILEKENVIEETATTTEINQ